MQNCLSGRKWQGWLGTISLCYIFITRSFQTNPIKRVYECEFQQTTMLLLISSNLSLFVIGCRRYYDSYTAEVQRTHSCYYRFTRSINSIRESIQTAFIVYLVQTLSLTTTATVEYSVRTNIKTVSPKEFCYRGFTLETFTLFSFCHLAQFLLTILLALHQTALNQGSLVP